MRVNIIRFGIDTGLVVTFVLVFVTGIIKMPEFFATSGLSHLVLPMYQITLIHDRSGVLFGILVILHLAVNAKRLASMGKDLFR